MGSGGSNSEDCSCCGGRPRLGVAWTQRVESGTSVGEKTELALVEQWRFRGGVPQRMRPWSRQGSKTEHLLGWGPVPSYGQLWASFLASDWTRHILFSRKINKVNFICDTPSVIVVIKQQLERNKPYHGMHLHRCICLRILSVRVDLVNFCI